MKKAGINLLFFVILFAILAGLSVWAVEISKEHEELIQERNRSLIGIKKEPAFTLDALVVGDSLTYTSVSPMQLWDEYGMTTYICGQSGQRIQGTYYMLKTAFKTQSPGLVILETNVMFRKQSGISGIKSSLAECRNYYLPIFKLHNAWKLALTGGEYGQGDYKGFLIRKKRRRYKGGKYMTETEKKEAISGGVEEYMEKIIKLCEKNDAKLILLSTPSPENYNYKKHNTLEEYARKRKLNYLDLNLHTEEIGIDWKKDSLDKGDHLNLSGAKKVTAYLGKYLKHKYEFLDHRGDDSYESWKKLFDDYEAKIRPADKRKATGGTNEKRR